MKVDNITHIKAERGKQKMNKSNFSNNVTKLATVPQAVERYKLSRNTLMRIADEENAVRRFGRAVRIDVQIMDTAINNY